MPLCAKTPMRASRCWCLWFDNQDILIFHALTTSILTLQHLCFRFLLHFIPSTLCKRLTSIFHPLSKNTLSFTLSRWLLLQLTSSCSTRNANLESTCLRLSTRLLKHLVVEHAIPYSPRRPLHSWPQTQDGFPRNPCLTHYRCTSTMLDLCSTFDQVK